jgi:acyl-CoA synthetase (AMP-forming)/AMP-acid ligase II
LANSSTDYLLTIYGFAKLGVVCFPLSIRNSKAALEHLIKATGVSYLIVGPGQMHVELDGLTILPLEQVDWNVGDTFPSPPNKKTDNDSLESLRMIFHRYVKLPFLMLLMIRYLIAVRVQRLFQNQYDIRIVQS